MIHSQQWILRKMAIKRLLILLFDLSIIFLVGSNGWCSGFASAPTFNVGWGLVGTNKCSTESWLNLVPGGTISCDSTGCTCTPTPTETVSFTTGGGDYSVTPSTSVVVPGCSSVALNVCVTPSLVGDQYGLLSAAVSPPYSNGQTTDSESIHVKGIPSLVTCEPLSSTLNLGSIQVGQTAINSFNVCNYNSFPVTINSISINNNYFSVVSGVNTVIPAVINQYNPSCQSVVIEFAPQTAGSFNANIQVNTTAQNPTYSCSGTGTYLVTPSAGANGRISPNTPQAVGQNGTVSFTVTPNTGYHISSVTGCGGTLVGNTYTTGPITGNCAVSATFVINTYTVTPTASANGSISPNTLQSVAYYDHTSFTVTPNAGFYMSVTGCGGTLVGNTYTTGPITGNCTVSATFASARGPAFSMPTGILLVAAGLGVILWRRRMKKQSQ